MTKLLLPLAPLILLAAPAGAQEAVIAIPDKPAKPAPSKPRPAAKPAAKDKPAAKPMTKDKPAVAVKPAAKARPAAAKPMAKPAKPPKLSDRATDGAFGILQVSAPDATQFIADWRAGTASKAISAHTVADQPLFVFIVFRGCKADVDGACNVTADYAIRRPDGSIDDDHKDQVVWRRAAPDDPAKPYLGDGALGFGTDSEGPFGDYRITATVTDHVAGITLKTEQVLTVSPADTPKPPDPAKVDGPAL